MKHFLTFLILISLPIQVCAVTIDLDRMDSNYRETTVTRANGYYVDGRGQVPEYARIAPPHEENIPKVSHPTKTVVPWDRYYDINKQGYRPMGYQMPLVPNYNVHYSNRRANPYTRAEYVSVWCNGEADLEKGICTVGNTRYYFYKVQDWAMGVAAAPMRDLKRRDGKKRGYIFCVDELGLDAEAMHAAKEWAELFDSKIHFVTIDAYIPLDYLL
jgi:hypothetical protein